MIGERSLKFGQFRLASGGTSDVFFNLKMTLLDPEGLNLAADLILDVIEPHRADAIGGLTLGACPIVDAVCVKSRKARPILGFYVRKDRKATGTGQLIEGPVSPRSNVIIVDDVTTQGGSALKAVHAVRQELDCNVLLAVTVVDREVGAADALAKEGIQLIPLFRMEDFAAWRDRH